MSREVVYSPRAVKQLTDLYAWVADQSGFADRAEDFVSSIVDYCDGLAEFPFIGASRDDLRPGLRTIGYRRRVVIAFAVVADTVEIHGVYYGGQDFESRLSTESD